VTAEKNNKIKSAVLNKYGAVARKDISSPPESLKGSSDCCASACCVKPSPGEISSALGYSPEEVAAVPEGANMGLGCGNPQAIAALRPGETVLDLGCGGGFDAFLAANQVGAEGLVIGVDMTPEMIERARRNADSSDFKNTSFRLGEIENLPVDDAIVDVIISNCVINLSSDKRAVYQEAFRVLKPGGRLAISDVVATTPLPEALKKDLELWAACAAGAPLIKDLEAYLSEAGFRQIVIDLDEESRDMIGQWAPGQNLEKYIVSARIHAVKPDN
jgi:SAM-dependent methyltransferase